MAGTDQLVTQEAGRQLAVLVERTKNTEEYIKASAIAFADLAKVVNRIEMSQIQTNESLTARSEANRIAITNLDAKVDHKAGSSIQRDQQQVAMLRAEEAARVAAIKESEAERDRLLKDQQDRHDKDIASLQRTIDTVSGKVDKLTDKAENAIFWARAMTGVAAFASVLGGAAFSAWLRTIVP